MTAYTRVAIVLLLAALLAAILGQLSKCEITPEARDYLEQALNTLQTKSLNRHDLEWPTIHAQALRTARCAKTTRDTYTSIRQALAALGDDHSFLVEPTDSGPASTVLNPVVTPPDSRRIDEHIGYIRVPAFSGADTQGFATDIRAAIRNADSPDVCAWVVDLRGNSGGNMWPMLQGLAPILGQETPGYFLSPDGKRTPWHVDVSQLEDLALHNQNPPVAVLYDQRTSSSGEAIAVAFRGRPRTRSFGHGTAGLSTANQAIRLSDGALLFLTVAVFLDRTNQSYGGVIQPDELASSTANDQEVLSKAASWLRRQQGCD